jgi:hypothetical protein
MSPTRRSPGFRTSLAAGCAFALAVALLPGLAVAQEGPATLPDLPEVETQYPHVCRTAQNGLGQPIVDNQDGEGIPVAREDENGNYPNQGGYPTGDAEIIGWSRDCEVETQYRYLYKDTGGTFRALADPDDLPGDVAMTTTTEGDEVPYVVRLEQGTIDRFIYSVAMLAPEGEADPAAPDTSLWNGRLLFSFQGGVAIGYTQGSWSQSAALFDGALQQGYAVINSTGIRTNTHYNLIRGGQHAVNLKDHFVDVYDDPIYTIGVGGSGGAIQQYVYAQNHPGLLDGGVPQMSYPDMATQTIHIGDCELLEHYMERTDADNTRWRDITERTKLVGLNAEQAPVLSGGNRAQFNQLYQLFTANGIPTPNGWDNNQTVPLTECRPGWFGLTPLAMNPLFSNVAGRERLAEGTDGVHWTHWNDAREVYGVDEDGWARQTWDNVGVQYGLGALRDGGITPEEFLDVNAYVGGWKHASEMVDEGCPYVQSRCANPTADFDPWSSRQMNLSPGDGAPAPRTEGDLIGIANAYERGHVFLGELDIPIIDSRYYMEHQLDMHNTHQSFAARQRLLDGQGHHDNQVVWFVDARPTSAAYDPTLDAFEVLHDWITNIRENPEAGVGANRPADARDACWERDGTLIARGDDAWSGVLDDGAPGACTEAFELYTTSRIEAGGPITGDVYKCHTMPVATAVDEGIYGDHTWAAEELARLEEIHPAGVCDYGLAGVNDPRHDVPDAVSAAPGAGVVKVTGARPNAEVELRQGGEVVATGTASQAGAVDVAAPLGTYVVAQRADGRRGVLSAPVTVTEEAPPKPPTPPRGLPFSDIDNTFVHTPAIVRLADRGILLGYPDGTFRPFDDLTRGQMASIVARALGLAPVATGPFPDVDGVHAGAINALAAAEIVRGRPDGTFDLHAGVTRAQLSTMLSLAAGLDLIASPSPFPDTAGSVHEPAINALADAGVIRGFEDGTFRPNLVVNRAQAATFVSGTLDVIEAD